MKWRALGVVFFAGVTLYGVVGFLGLSGANQKAALIWGVGGVVLHDFLFAPLVLGTGSLVSRLQRPLRVGVQVTGVVGGTALIATLPTWLAVAQGNAEPGFLPLDYTTSLLQVALVGALVGVVAGLLTWRNERKKAVRADKEGSDIAAAQHSANT